MGEGQVRLMAEDREGLTEPSSAPQMMCVASRENLRGEHIGNYAEFEQLEKQNAETQSAQRIAKTKCKAFFSASLRVLRVSAISF